MRSVPLRTRNRDAGPTNRRSAVQPEHQAPLLQVDGLTVELRASSGYVPILEDVSFRIERGDTVGLAGESGSGKTMTALALMGLLPKGARVSGHVRFEGVDLLTLGQRQLCDFRGRELGMVFQEPMTSLHPSLRVGDQIAESVRVHQKATKDAAQRWAVEMLDLVGIPQPGLRARQYPHELSGGMQQRVMIAIALACRPKLLIADEPTTALDVTIQAQVIDLLRSLQEELDLAVLFVTHDLGLLAGFCRRLIVMYAGQVIEMSPMAELVTRPRHPYTKALMLAAPNPVFKGQRLPTIAGSPPRPGTAGVGCRFAPRCEHRVDACELDAVPFELLGPRRDDACDGEGARCIRQHELDLSVTF